ncbi:MAG: acyl-CoA dehydrogenase family protein [Armatimonadetes bacterium]|nr:acyl-CoA dehydrogenase family protein [Armatimonadota bacterium]MDE2205499.1 acyl-CoA dehydrogenase family protein [Armatimonadota bacterium]
MTRNPPIGGGFLTMPADGDPGFAPEDLSAEERLMGRTAAEFLAGEVLPQTERIESGDTALMHGLMQQAGSLGLLAGDIPAIYGGLGASQAACALIAENLNWQQSFALTHEAHTVIGTLPLLYFGSADQKRRYLPSLASGEYIASFALSEAGSGSDALAAAARATRSADGKSYTLTGEKMWITNTAFAGLFTVFAQVEGSGLTAFLVERDSRGFGFGREEHKLGMKGTSTRRLLLDDVLVPAENAMEPGRGHYAALCALNMGRMRLEAGATGGIKQLLGACCRYAKQRHTFGKALAEYGLILSKLGAMAADLFALETMVYRLAGDLDRLFAPIDPDGGDAGAKYHHAAQEMALECNAVKVFGSEAYSLHADEAIQIHGGNGYTEEYPFARTWRDQRLLRIGEGANEIVRVALINQLDRRIAKGAVALLDDDAASFSEEDLERALRGIIGAAHRELTRCADAMHPADAQVATAALADLVVSLYACSSMRMRTERSTGERRSVMQRLRDAAEDRLTATATGALAVIRRTLPQNNLATTRLERRRSFGPNPCMLLRLAAEASLERDGYPL